MIKKKSNKPIPGMRRELTKVFNKYIRLRDRKFGCISCTTGAVENAGHFKSRGAHPHPSIAFSEMNTHGQCIRCNYTLAGNIPGYTVGLRNRYGLQILHDIDTLISVRQNPWTRFEYEQMIILYTKKLKDINAN